MLRKRDVLTILTSLAVIVPIASVAAQESRLDPNNPNCSPGVPGCTANYPASHISTETLPPQSAAVPEPNNGGGPAAVEGKQTEKQDEAKQSGQKDDASQK